MSENDDYDPKKVATRAAVETYKDVKEKYSQSRKIVEGKKISSEIIVQGTGSYKPHLEVLIDDQLVGHINDPNKSEDHNTGIFQVECYKRGNENWDQKVIALVPLGNASKYLKRTKKNTGFGQGTNGSEVLNVYIPLHGKMSWYGGTKKFPAPSSN